MFDDLQRESANVFPAVVVVMNSRKRPALHQRVRHLETKNLVSILN